MSVSQFRKFARRYGTKAVVATAGVIAIAFIGIGIGWMFVGAAINTAAEDLERWQRKLERSPFT